ncbi:MULTISPECIES: DUF6482 family protein [unclassified Cobetia]|uniref:DUF6482 family protein n=1 Tax=unclassified Cobetia TaxID=2609414 RepID=UPI002097BC1F|nr:MULTISPECIES: DUF6482 family protein [unclassified Cobetia]MCO7232490.1 DUF6482 family protein [Cobetia sp. Dlab-2-AX]MCO7235764.1 DUF6482 family protein [Cobetia sp. Dlab-2-U]
MSRTTSIFTPSAIFTSNLQALMAEYPALEARVISHAASRFYQVQLVLEAAGEEGEERSELLMKRGKPMLFRSLEDVYSELKRGGMSRAWLVSQVANDEMIGRPPQYHQPLSSRIPLSF